MTKTIVVASLSTHEFNEVEFTVQLRLFKQLSVLLTIKQIYFIHFFFMEKKHKSQWILRQVFPVKALETDVVLLHNFERCVIIIRRVWFVWNNLYSSSGA